MSPDDRQGDDDADAAAYEARVRETWMRRRARLGVFLIVAGLAGMVAIPLLIASSSDTGAEQLLRVLPGAVLSLACGVYVLAAGLPGDRAGDPVPRSLVIRTAAWIVPIVVLVGAWPLGAYRAIWHRAALVGTPCDELVPIRAIEQLGVRARPISRVERTLDRCLVELAPIPGSRDVASFQLVVEPGTRDEIARIARRAGRRAAPLPAIGPDAWRIEHQAGWRILVWRAGSVIRLQLARSAWSGEAFDRLIAHLGA